MTALLDVRGLSKSFGGVEAVRDVSFALAAGELLALIGPNGAGKSTCFGMLGGQVRPDAGRVRLAGADITGLKPRRIWARGVGRTFQTAETFASMTVAENVETALHGRTAARSAETRRLLGLVGLAAAAGRPAGTLSYGDVKRLELALALSNTPRLLLMDEPTAGMAAAERTALMQLVAGLARERQVGVLFTEHDMDVVFAHADRILVLDRGLLIAEGPPEAIRADPQVRAVYLGEGLTFSEAG
ncbi:ABC transporter ATP-binding protein [Aquabacter spiritensis]|uniref:Amino acid/amide ABC transporter ATP-binding protein 1 (HAAT family) n=1 Tax=Aquabacter spiritensis TaxID=933073 RepID=A0A4R3LWX0_9HYPH|nr:ABC transporter ATP-binding protein [Aquabacter spiritensis]TCT05120.1 amino acid/amide ABC transporter ATP-binding protein 1 (HAAT family) [Aquabacter spiritensis]